MRFYLDTCCYNRPYDDQAHERIHLEGEAVLAVISKCKQCDDEIIGSPALDFEIEQIAHIEKAEKVMHFYNQTIDKKCEYNSTIHTRVKELSKETVLRMLDRFHLAFAENAQAAILLTTDDKFEKACSKIKLKLKVMNPLNYLLEEMKNGSED